MLLEAPASQSIPAGQQVEARLPRASEPGAGGDGHGSIGEALGEDGRRPAIQAYFEMAAATTPRRLDQAVTQNKGPQVRAQGRRRLPRGDGGDARSPTPATSRKALVQYGRFDIWRATARVG